MAKKKTARPGKHPLIVYPTKAQHARIKRAAAKLSEQAGFVSVTQFIIQGALEKAAQVLGE